MPWRLAPRSAFIGVASASALIAAAGGLRRSEPASAAVPLPLTIDNSLKRDEQGCAGVRSTVWHPLSGLDYTGKLRITLPPHFGGAIAMYVGDSLPLDIEAQGESGDPVVMDSERFVLGPGVIIPPDYWLEDGSPTDAPPHVTKLVIDASGEETRHVRMALGRRAPRVLARLIGYPPDVRVPICAESIAPGELYFATGWYGEERDPVEGAVRWMREHGAVLITSPAGRAARVRLRAAPAVAADAGVRVSLRVNDRLELVSRPLEAGFHEYEWEVPDPAWAPGTNELLFTVSQTRRSGSRTLGLALASLDVQ